jgi:hypothetical protein
MIGLYGLVWDEAVVRTGLAKCRLISKAALLPVRA